MHLNKSLRWLVLKAPLFKHATTSKSGGQVLYNCVSSACFQRTLCHKKKDRKFCICKILYCSKIPDLVIYIN